MKRVPWFALLGLLVSCTSVHDVALGADEPTPAVHDGGRTMPDDDDERDRDRDLGVAAADAEAGRNMTTNDGSLDDVDARVGLADAAVADSATAQAADSGGAATRSSPDAGNSFVADADVVADSDDLDDAGQAHGDELRHL